MATLRPHLLFGATAVLAPPGHPAAGAATVYVPVVDLTLPVVADQRHRDRILGDHLSAVLPAYNSDDFDAVHARDQAVVNVFASDGTLTLPGTPYDGYDPADCDRLLVERWSGDGVLTSTEPYLHGDARHTLCDGAVVPRVGPQWFIRVRELKPTARWLLEHPVTRLNHTRWEERYRQVIRDVLDGDAAVAPWWEGACLAFVRGFSSNRDWMVSRQNWWGIPVPAWHCPACDETTVSTSESAVLCERCGDLMRRSDDVLDVLFHSALWAACVTTDTRRAYHADLAVIGHDILEFWIPTANLLSRPLFGSVSIREVFVHGVICDATGRKMSKSAGNALSLEGLLQRYGTEVTRGVVLDLAEGAAGDQSVVLTQEGVDRAAERVGRLTDWCASVVVAEDVHAPELDRELARVRAYLGEALDGLDVGGAYRRVSALVDRLPPRVTAWQRAQVAAIVEHFHPQLVTLL